VGVEGSEVVGEVLVIDVTIKTLSIHLFKMRLLPPMNALHLTSLQIEPRQRLRRRKQTFPFRTLINYLPQR
jgi:hypothetical protein